MKQLNEMVKKMDECNTEDTVKTNDDKIECSFEKKMRRTITSTNDRVNK
jgi:hypothetical protein